MSTMIGSSSLELTFFNVWTTPLESIDRFKYHVVFINHFTIDIWLYPPKKKTDVHTNFFNFTNFVEFFFNA